MKSPVYYFPMSQVSYTDLAVSINSLLETLISQTGLALEKHIPLKIHFGEPGNTSYLTPEYLTGILDFFSSHHLSSCYIETNTITGDRSRALTHLQIARDHGFTQLPCVIADGQDGLDDLEVPITSGRVFSSCRIARQIVESPQILLATHFKGHSMSGFGGTLKNLGIGFASGRGKAVQHCKIPPIPHQSLNWEDSSNLYFGSEFRYRTAEYALAAVNHKSHIYLSYALNLVADCDCDGTPMQPLYNNVGVFASLDPVAIDAASLDLITRREGHPAFSGDEILDYAQNLGLGNRTYDLIKIKT